MTGVRALAVAVIGMTVAGCDSPSAGVDGGNLHGVFSRDAQAAPAASTATASARASASADAGAAEKLPELRRKPRAGPCAELLGPSRLEPPRPRPGERALRRPGCRGARILEWRGPEGNPRYACVTGPRDAPERAPLPLLIFFHAEHDTPRAVGRSTKLRRYNERLDLTGDPKRQGFLTLAVQGRAIQGRHRFAVVPATRDNPDVKTVDHFVAELRQEGLVDASRVYTVGYGEGSPMAMLYAMLRPDLVSAVALFAGAPTQLGWGCDGTAPPVLLMYRACDAVASCEQMERWLDRWRQAGHTAVGLRLGAGNKPETHCAQSKKCRGARGEANHRRWPKGKEPEVIEFLARYRMQEGP